MQVLVGTIDTSLIRRRRPSYLHLLEGKTVQVHTYKGPPCDHRGNSEQEGYFVKSSEISRVTGMGYCRFWGIEPEPGRGSDIYYQCTFIPKEACQEVVSR